MKQYILLTLIIACMTNQIMGLDCDIFGQRITLGDYYGQKNDKTNLLTIAANTNDDCTDSIELKIKVDKQEFLVEPFVTKLIDTEKYTGDSEYEYKITSYFFKIKLTADIKEGTTFNYIIYQKEENVSEDNYFTTTVPYKNAQDGQIDSIFVYGDYDANVQELGKDKDYYGQVTHEYLNKQLQKGLEKEFDQMLFLGDMSYDISDEKYKRGDKFFKKVAPYYGSIPQINTYGNHESGGELENFDYKFVNDYFYMPDYTDGKNRNFEFDSIYAQFINFDAKFLWYNEDQKDIDRVINQLEQQLKEANNRRDIKPWIIVYTHYPIYFTEDDNETETEKSEIYNNFNRAEKLLNQYEVDLYLSAHVHNYQSFYPTKYHEKGKFEMKENKDKSVQFENPDCPLYIVDGVAGQAHSTRKVEIPERDILRIQDVEQPGGGLLRIYNNTHLQYQHIRTADEQIIDNVWIIKDEQSSDLITYLIIGGVVILLLILGGALFWYNKKQQLIKKGQQSIQELQGSQNCEQNKDLESNKAEQPLLQE